MFGLFLPESSGTGTSYAAAAVLGLIFSFEVLRLLRGREWKQRILYPALVAAALGILLQILHRGLEGSSIPPQFLRHLGVTIAITTWSGLTWLCVRELWERPTVKKVWAVWIAAGLVLIAVLTGGDASVVFLAGALFFAVSLSWRRLRTLRPVMLVALVAAAVICSLFPVLVEDAGSKLLIPTDSGSGGEYFVRALAISILDGSRILLRALAFCVMVFGTWHWMGEMLFGAGRVRAKLLGSYLLTAIAPLLLFAMIFGLATYLFTVTYRSTLTRKLLVMEQRSFEKWVTSLSLRRAFWESIAGEKGAEKHLPLALLDLYPDATFDVLEQIGGKDRTVIRYTRQGARADTLVIPPEYAKGGVCIAHHGGELCIFTLLSTEKFLLRAWIPLSKDFLKKVRNLAGTDIEFHPEYQLSVTDSQGIQVSISGHQGVQVKFADTLSTERSGATSNGASTVEESSERGLLDMRVVAGVNTLDGLDWKTGEKTRIPYILTFTPRMIYEDLFNPDERLNEGFRLGFMILCTVFLGVMFLISWLGWKVAGGLNRSAKLLEKGVQELRAGHLQYEMPVEGGAEFRQVAESFNMLTRDIRRMLRDLTEKERIEGELSLARSIQQALLPQRLPELHAIQIAARSVPAKEVGGDYYDILELENGKILLALGDVSGKGMASALVMARTQSLLRSLARREDDLQELMSELNRGVCDGAHPGMFVSLFVALLDPKQRTLEYVNGGHDHPLLCRGDSIETLETGGIVLGVFPDVNYLKDEIQIGKQACLLMYTDGLPETKDDNEMELGSEGLTVVLKKSATKNSAEVILDGVFAHAEAHANNRPAEDDRTAMVLVFA
jgi:serine phosphatase RsbU (regulator of sigma subunit)